MVQKINVYWNGSFVNPKQPGAIYLVEPGLTANCWADRHNLG